MLAIGPPRNKLNGGGLKKGDGEAWVRILVEISGEIPATLLIRPRRNNPGLYRYSFLFLQL